MLCGIREGVGLCSWGCKVTPEQALVHPTQPLRQPINLSQAVVEGRLELGAEQTGSKSRDFCGTCPGMGASLRCTPTPGALQQQLNNSRISVGLLQAVCEVGRRNGVLLIKLYCFLAKWVKTS